MRHAFYALATVLLSFLVFIPNKLYADVNNNQVINHEMADRINDLKEANGYSSEDFNACQITWGVRKLENNDPLSHFQPHAITLQYENNKIIELINEHDGSIESIQDLGPNCLEYNNYVYLFIDSSNYATRVKFNLTDLSYVTYSSDKGVTWSPLLSLHQYSTKAKFILPQDRFQKYVKIFGNRHNHALSIFNLRDETTYLFSPTFNILKAVPVYNRLSNFNYPTDFYYHKNILYLVRGSCEKIKGRFQCPSRTYMETSRNFGQSWEKETLPFMKKSYLLTINNSLYHFIFKPCPSSWFNIVPGLNRSLVCGQIQVKKLDILGQWGKPITLIRTADRLLDVYTAEKPILVWKDFRFHKSRACGLIPIIGCVDSNPFTGPNVIFAAELNTENWELDESIIEYTN